MNCPLCHEPNRYGQISVDDSSVDDSSPADGDIGICDHCGATFIYDGQNPRLASASDVAGYELVIRKAQMLIFERLAKHKDLAWLKHRIRETRKQLKGE